jgi:hypothetical protein
MLREQPHDAGRACSRQFPVRRKASVASTVWPSTRITKPVRQAVAKSTSRWRQQADPLPVGVSTRRHCPGASRTRWASICWRITAPTSGHRSSCRCRFASVARGSAEPVARAAQRGTGACGSGNKVCAGRPR